MKTIIVMGVLLRGATEIVRKKYVREYPNIGILNKDYKITILGIPRAILELKYNPRTEQQIVIVEDISALDDSMIVEMLVQGGWLIENSIRDDD